MEEFAPLMALRYRKSVDCVSGSCRFPVKKLVTWPPVSQTCGSVNWGLPGCAAQNPESMQRRQMNERRKERLESDMGDRAVSGGACRHVPIYHAQPTIYEAKRGLSAPLSH